MRTPKKIWPPLEIAISRAGKEIAELYDLQDRLEQNKYTRKNSLEFHGISESANSSPEEVALKISEALDVSVGTQDIAISHKLNNEGNKAIIAKFISHKVNSNLYRARTQLKSIKVTDLSRPLLTRQQPRLTGSTSMKI